MSANNPGIIARKRANGKVRLSKRPLKLYNFDRFTCFKMKLIVLIPAFNEEEKIGQVIESIPKQLTGVGDIGILVVDDGSTDKTGEITLSKNAILLKHKKNLGLGRSFQDGLEKAIEMKADILLTIDADGQFDPGEIDKLIEPILKQEADLVTGSRFLNKNCLPDGIPWIKKWGNHRVANIISWTTGQKFHDVSCGFRAYNKEAMLRMNLFGKFTYTQETFLDLANKGLHIVEVPVTVKYFADRKSKIAGSIMNYAIKSANIMILTVKNYKPLKFFGWFGFWIFLTGLGLDAFVITHFFRVGTFSPYKIFAFAGGFLNAIGILVMFLGILADLIDKIRLTEEKILYYEKKRFYDS